MRVASYKDKVRFFDEQAAGWDWPDVDRIKTLKILKSVGLPVSGIILDAGCGAGNLFPVLKKITPSATIIACDLSRQMLNASRYRFPDQDVPFWVGYCEQLPLPNASVDMVLNYCIYPHIKDGHIALIEYHRILKSGGRLLIIHPHGREAINFKHRQMGFPVDNDLLPPSRQIVAHLDSLSFLIRRVIDQDDLYLIEAQKSQYTPPPLLNIGTNRTGMTDL